MADSSKDTGELKPPAQSEEVRDVNLARAPAGVESATGIEKRELADEYEEPEDRGSTVPIAGGEPESDLKGEGKPRGLQAEPAAFATNGSTSSTRVATPSGPQPVAAFASTPDQAQKLLEEHRKREEESIRNRARGTQEITEAKLDSMSSQEIRAVAHDRDYDLPDHASKGLAKRLFLEKQSEDKTIEGYEEENTTEEEQ